MDDTVHLSEHGFAYPSFERRLTSFQQDCSQDFSKPKVRTYARRQRGLPSVDD